MFLVKITFLFTAVFAYILLTVLVRILFCLHASLRLALITGLTQVLASFLLFMLGIKVVIEGEKSCLQEKGTFVISNHLGYLDGLILGSILRIIYVSKSQVKKWPVFGWMASVSETVFIDRQRKTKTSDYITKAEGLLKSGVNLLVFPEGTSTNGLVLRPFQSVHFQAAINAGASILPLLITYTKADNLEVIAGNSDTVCWYGQVAFFRHILGVLRMKNIQAKITILPRIEPAEYLENALSRKELSEKLYRLICQHYPLFA